MPQRFLTINQYFAVEPRVSVRTLQLNGLLLSELEETSNDISISKTLTHSLLMSESGSDHHRVRIDDAFREAPTRPDDIALVPAGVALESAWRAPNEAMRTFTLEFDTALFRRFAPEVYSDRFARGHLIAGNYGPRPQIAALLRLLKREMNAALCRGTLFSDEIIRLLVLELATDAWSCPAVLPRDRDQRDRRIARAIDFIEAHLCDDISLTEIASAAALSPSQLTCLFREHTGSAPYAFVVNRRIEKAVRLLRTSDMPIAEIALAAGFADQQHLTRMMRARRGQTPGMVRRRKHA